MLIVDKMNITEGLKTFLKLQTQETPQDSSCIIWNQYAYIEENPSFRVYR